MSEFLNISQLKHLQEVLITRLDEYNEVVENIDNTDYLKMFLSAKKVEGCSEETIKFYEITIKNMFKLVRHPIREITTEILRNYLIKYQGINNCSKVTLDNVRRNLSSFFSWLEDEDYILKNPIRRIHKMKTQSVVKKVITDEMIELIREGCLTLRDLAVVELLYATGIRISELVNLNISNIDFEERMCIVLGKGDKERLVYFDAKTKMVLLNYIRSRKDKNDALFVSFNQPHNRIKRNCIEYRLRLLGRRIGVWELYPHKFRRTMATRAIDKGTPIEQVQQILGHCQINTTMMYAVVSQSNTKFSYKKYIGS